MTLIFGAITWSLAAGLLAWAFLPHPRPAVLIAAVAGALGWTATLLADELGGFHALHPSRPESLLPATTIAVLVLLAARWRGRRRRRRTIFF